MTSTTTITTIKRLLLALGLLSGCAASTGAVDPSGFPPAVEAAVDPNFPLTWSVEPKDGALSIRWKIQNNTDASVWLLDTDFVPVAAGYERQPDRITVLPGAERGLARLVRGHLRPPPGQGVAVEYTPAARELQPGATQQGRAAVTLPLASWHPYYVLPPLPRGLERVVLELGMLVGDPPEGVDAWEGRFRSVPEGMPVKTPTLGYVVQRQRFVAGETLALPR